MEDLSNRFPSLIPMILENVDNQSLVNFKETSRELRDFVDSERFYWIKIIEKYKGSFEEFSKCWKKVIERTPSQIVKRIALAVEIFFSTNQSNRQLQTIYEKYNQWSPLHISAASRDSILINHVIEKTKFENHKSATNNLSPLHIAVNEGGLEACELILNHSLYMIKKTDGYCLTPLYYAVILGHFDVCKIFLDNLDDQNPPQEFYLGPLRNTAMGGNFEVFNLFFQAAKDKNLPLNPPDGMNTTPLHLAAKFGHLEICKLILEEVEEKSPVDDYGCTPFQLAAKNGHFAVCKFIIRDEGIWQKFKLYVFYRSIFYYDKYRMNISLRDSIW